MRLHAETGRRVHHYLFTGNKRGHTPGASQVADHTSRLNNHSNYGIVLQRKPACACGGVCPKCRAKQAELQAKLQISKPGDRYEQEADAVADRVMRMPDSEVVRQDDQTINPISRVGISRLQRQDLPEQDEEEIQTKPRADSSASVTSYLPPLTQEETEEEPEEAVQTKPAATASRHDGAGLQHQINGFKSGGTPLPAQVREYFDPRFGYNFDNVRVHTGAQAKQASSAISARAFTHGSNIVFGAGQYAPQSFEGKRLLAHELTHVVQQSGGSTDTSIQSSQEQIQRKKTYGNCKVKSFSVTVDPWNTTWIGFTRRLPVNFNLELDKGSTKHDCVIGQEKKGQVEHGGSKDTFSRWTSDSGFGWRDWWDGKKWNAAQGSWSWIGEKADFKDEPGFNRLDDKQFPAYWGGVGKKGYFKFRTYVAQRGVYGKNIRELNWGMLIDYKTKDKGKEYFYL